MTSSHKPEVATNQNGQTVAAALSGFWGHWIACHTTRPDIAVASAYFNPGGWDLLSEQLEQAGQVRLLLGAEPDVSQEMLRPRRLGGFPEDIKQDRLREALRSHDREMAGDRNLIAFRPGEDELIRRMIAWLRSGTVEVRRLESDFLHGKAYLLETDGDGVLVGSSNFTRAGLTRNVELNLGQYQPHVVEQVQDWFNDLWSDAASYDLAGLYEQRFTVHDPFVVFLRMLWERYADELGQEDVEIGLGLTRFQSHGVARARALLERFNGVLIADGVGLGKTYVAGELMRHANRDLRQRVLLVAPAALRDGPWAQFLSEHDRELHVDMVSYEQLSGDPRVGGDGNHAPGMRHHPDEYAMVVIDEAHAYRNTDTDRSAALRRLLAGTPQKQLVLLSATPVNNGLMDLYNLLAYFIRNDGQFIDLGIPSLRKRFNEAAATSPDDLSPDVLFDILDAVAVRRTRRFIKQFYEGERLPNGELIRFPQPEVRRVDYDLEQVLPGFFEEFAYALGVDPSDPDSPIPDISEFDYGHQLNLARYAPSYYAINPDELDVREGQAVGLLRSGLLKRFESSAYAFARTCRKMATSHEVFLAALDDGWVLTGDALAAYARTDTDEFDPDEIASGGTREPVGHYDLDTLRDHVQADRDLLLSFAARAEQITPGTDPKLEALKQALGDIALQAKADAVGPARERTNRKVLVFSYFQDTVNWIVSHLEAASANDPRLVDYVNRITFVSGDDGDKADAMFGFAPISSQAPPGRDDDRYDLLVATDVLAEGVNLQQSRHIINYDLPWNPMRLVQRHGRIDRIGSPHDKVWMRCFFPSRLLDDLLGLEVAIQRKIAQAAASIGTEAEIVPGSAVRDGAFADTEAQIRAIEAEDASLLETAEEGGALSGEEFRRILDDAMHDPLYAEQVEHLPWVAGSGYVTEHTPGFVFCAHVGNHPEAVYRWVPVNPDGTLNWLHPDPDDTDTWITGAPDPAVDGLSRDTLAALGRAQCDPTTVRHLPDGWRQSAYDAWAAAKDDILRDWTAKTDPQALRPPVPKPMRDAVALLERDAPTDMDAALIDRLRETLEAPYDHRTQRAVRQAITADGSHRDRIDRLVAVVEDLGLQPPDPVQPLPEIIEQDVHLVCWLALIPDSPDAQS